MIGITSVGDLLLPGVRLSDTQESAVRYLDKYFAGGVLSGDTPEQGSTGSRQRAWQVFVALAQAEHLQNTQHEKSSEGAVRTCWT